MLVCTRVLPGRRKECRKTMTARTDSIGRVLWLCQHCAWQQQGRCWCCGAARTTSAKGLYCDRCRIEAKRASWNRYEPSPNAHRAQRKRERRRNQSDHRKAWRKAWREKNPDRIRAYKRKEALNPTPQRKARERWWNAQPERQAKKREQAKRRYYQLHPDRPQPMCRECAQPIAWTPPGRPPVRCDQCVTPSVLLKRKKSHHIMTPCHPTMEQQAA